MLHKRGAGLARLEMKPEDGEPGAAPLSAAWSVTRLRPSALPDPIATQGTSGADHMVGTANADHLEGLGGNDLLEGLAGDDLLEGGDDDDILRGGAGSDAFVTGTAALDADDRILYDAGTGKLYFDADGNGAGAAVLFATLSGNPVIGAGDFIVI